jgi:hypothetical protein
MENQGSKRQILYIQAVDLFFKFNYLKREAESSGHLHSVAKSPDYIAEHMNVGRHVEAEV